MTSDKQPKPQGLSEIPLEAIQAMSYKPDPQTIVQQQALARLIEAAKGDTGQSRCIAEFLLAWWNADIYGGFDLTKLWAVDLPLCRDMQTVFSLIAEQHHYPDHFELTDDFKEIIRQWRLENLD